MTPLFKWVGGKRRLGDLIAAHVPAHCTTWVEPFVGAGGALLTAGQRCTRHVVADVNPRVVNVHWVVKTQPDALCDDLARLPWDGVDEDTYTRLRDACSLCNVNEEPVRAAALILWLARFGFNGLYRENRQGRLNVPWGKRATSEPLSRAQIQQTSAALQSATILCASFDTLGGPRRQRSYGSVVVYCDPPYLGAFSGYTRHGFEEADHRRLIAWCEAWAAAGATILLSNSGEVRRLLTATSAAWTVHDVAATCHVGGRGAPRGAAPEILAVLNGAPEYSTLAVER